MKVFVGCMDFIFRKNGMLVNFFKNWEGMSGVCMIICLMVWCVSNIFVKVSFMVIFLFFWVVVLMYFICI